MRPGVATMTCTVGGNQNGLRLRDMEVHQLVMAAKRGG